MVTEGFVEHQIELRFGRLALLSQLAAAKNKVGAASRRPTDAETALTHSAAVVAPRAIRITSQPQELRLLAWLPLLAEGPSPGPREDYGFWRAPTL